MARGASVWAIGGECALGESLDSSGLCWGEPTDRPYAWTKGGEGRGREGSGFFFLRPPHSRAWLNDALGVTGVPDGNGLRTTLFSTPGGREEGV